MQVYLRDGSARTIVCAATLRQKLQIKPILSSHYYYTDTSPISYNTDPKKPCTECVMMQGVYLQAAAAFLLLLFLFRVCFCLCGFFFLIRWLWCRLEVYSLPCPRFLCLSITSRRANMQCVPAGRACLDSVACCHTVIQGENQDRYLVQS